MNGSAAHRPGPSAPRVVLALEGLVVLLGSGVALFRLDAPWWIALCVLIGPDLSMFGYAFGPRIGAATYNTFHTYLLGAPLAGVALIGGPAWLTMTGLVILGHTGMDRMLGFGLKYATGFRDSHLGRV
ncbi:MAG: DUF4260 domain-containing protein [Phycisphaerales bacterium JB059]